MSASAVRVAEPEAINMSLAISQIYRYTQGGGLSGFKQNAMEQLAGLIDFDSACWFILTGDACQLTSENAFCFGLPEHLLTDYCQSFNHQLLADLQQSPEQAVITEVCALTYGIHQQMWCLVKQNNTQHIVVLNKKVQSGVFSAAQMGICRFVTGQLKQAFHLYLQSQLKKQWTYRHSYKAICDKNGQIVEAEPGFMAALAQNLVNWDNTTLPGICGTEQLPAKFEYGNIKVQLAQDKGAYVAEAYVFDQGIESLTTAEKTIAKHLVTAAKNKEIAERLKLSPKTIEHQVKSLCTKLEVSNRTEAIRILQHSNYRF